MYPDYMTPIGPPLQPPPTATTTIAPIIPPPMPRNLPQNFPEPPQHFRRQIVVTSAASITCPTGFNQAGDVCVRFDHLPSRLGCLEGWRFEEDKCLGVESSIPEFTCDPGFSGRGDECVKEIEAPKLLLCPDGFSISASGCSRYITTSTNASTSSTTHSGTCDGPDETAIPHAV
eukprot:Lankesteria_metandrocarpae@DN1943_c0_g1_i3.p1